MTVVWTDEAASNLEDIGDYIASDDRAAAYRVVGTIFDYVNDQLSQFPELGRPGRVADTRELVIPALPYIAAYRLSDRDAQVLAILHARRSWPESF